MNRLTRIAASLGAALVGLGPALAQAEYPSRAITIVVPFAAGGGGDTFTRAIADLAQERLGVNVLVENRTGGGGTIGVGSVARAANDGHTLGFVSTSPVVMTPNFSEVPFDPSTDITYVGRFVTSPIPMIVPADSPWQNFEELVEWMRENPGRLRWSTSATRGAPQIATEALFGALEVEGVHIPMQGGSEVLAALLGDTLDMGVISEYAEPSMAGQVRVLAQSGPEPLNEMPEVPTYDALGSPLAPSMFFGIIGPGDLPAEVTETWDSLLAEIVADPRFVEVAERLGGNLAFMPHEPFQAAVLRDIAAMRIALEDLGLLED